MNKTKQLTKQEYRILLDAYIRDHNDDLTTYEDNSTAREVYLTIRNKLKKLGGVEA